MAKIGAVKLKIGVKGQKANVDVTYDITFSKTDQKNKQAYKEICRLIGDDTKVGDPAAGGADDVLGFLSPINNKKTAPDEGDNLTVSRSFSKSYRKAQLDEDKGGLPGPDEIRALVTLVPLPAGTGKVVQRQSNVVKRQMGA